MQSPSTALLDIDGTSRGSSPNCGIHDRHGCAKVAADCARSQIADALTAIVFQAEAIRLGNVVARSAEAELDLSARHIIKSAKRVWSILGGTHEATCICRKPPT
jgi:hypothetical protein